MKIAIAGYGVEGKANYEYWSKDPANEVTIVDESVTPKTPLPSGAATILGPGAFQKLDGFDLVIRTAGLSPYKITTDGRVWSATNEFLEKCPAPIIGVTGTKGKGTTSSMIASILKAAGRKVWLVGNIGLASLDVLSEIQSSDIVVYELSSFQLWDAERSPHIAVVLGIEPEHLDVHRDFEDYVAAKGNIRRFQTTNDLCIYQQDNQYSVQIARSIDAPRQPYGLDASEGSHVRRTDDDEFFYVGEHIICSTSEVALKGRHNIDNACAAVAVAHHLSVSNDAIAEGLRDFKGLSHRLSFVATVDGVSYYDDSIATTPSSAIAAIDAFSEPKVIILGGSYKGSDFSELAAHIKEQADIQAILIGQEAPRIASALDAVGFDRYEIIENATATAFTRRAAELARPGSVVLLSPSAASFGLFKDYVDRGNQFIAAVNALSGRDPSGL